MPRRALIAAIAAILLVVGVGIPALAVTTQSWEERRIATEAFHAAAQSALDAAETSTAALDALDDARAKATPILEDAQAVASAAVGYFAEPLVTAVQSRASELETALSALAPEGSPIPDTERPEAVADLTAAVEPLTSWAAEESNRSRELATLAGDVSEAGIAAAETLATLGESVETEASTALGAAPLATPESRTAVEQARDVVLAAMGDESSLGNPIADYTAAVAALRVSQQAAAEAAAAAQEAADDAAFQAERDRIRRLLDEIIFSLPPICFGPPGEMICN